MLCEHAFAVETDETCFFPSDKYIYHSMRKIAVAKIHIQQIWHSAQKKNHETVNKKKHFLFLIRERF